MSASLEVKNVKRVISKKGKKIPILNDISFALESGTITALMGKSGCGKTTLLNILCGIDQPEGGTVVFAGKDYYKMKEADRGTFRNENIGVVFQNYHLIPELNCEENVRMPLCFSKKKDTGAVKLDSWFKIVGLEKKRRLFPNEMSGGEQQRTAILRAIVNNPRYIFADEPTGALDSKTGDQVIRFLVEYAHKKKATVLLATHDQDIADLCDRVIHMSDGNLVD